MKETLKEKLLRLIKERINEINPVDASFDTISFKTLESIADRLNIDLNELDKP